MKITKIGDLIPHRQSLQELWGKEEFQLVLGLLLVLKQEAVDSFASARLIDVSAENVKTASARLQTQYNLASLLLELPTRLKVLEEQKEQREQANTKMSQAQEGGEL
jgi:hypothetical protein